MAEQPPRRRQAVREERAEEIRNVRARLEGQEARITAAEQRLVNHETRIQYQEAPLRWVLRGFECVQEFFRTLPNGFMPAKKAFVNQFVTELRNNCPPDVGGSLDDLEARLSAADGWVLLGVFRTGGMMGDKIDGLIRFQPGLLGLECGSFLGTAARALAEPLVCHQDRVRKPKGQGKGKGDGVAEGAGKGKKGKGKAKAPGALPKQHGQSPLLRL